MRASGKTGGNGAAAGPKESKREEEKHVISRLPASPRPLGSPCVPAVMPGVTAEPGRAEALSLSPPSTC